MSGDSVIRIDPEAGGAVEAAWFAWDRFTHAPGPLAQAQALVDLAGHMSDLASWLPDYDARTGEVAEEAVRGEVA